MPKLDPECPSSLGERIASLEATLNAVREMCVIGDTQLQLEMDRRLTAASSELTGFHSAINALVDDHAKQLAALRSRVDQSFGQEQRGQQINATAVAWIAAIAAVAVAILYVVH